MDQIEWRRVRPQLTWEDCVTHLVVVGGEWRTSPSDVGAETGGGYSSEMRTVTGEGKQKSVTSIDAGLTLYFRCKEKSNNIIYIYTWYVST